MDFSVSLIVLISRLLHFYQVKTMAELTSLTIKELYGLSTARFKLDIGYKTTGYMSFLAEH